MDGVYTFTNRMHQVAELRGHLLVQLNVSLQLRGLAKNWYEMELNDSDKAMLSGARSIQIWTNALIQRFRPVAADMLRQLEQTHYTRSDAATRRDPVAFLHEILRLTRHDNGRTEHERLTIAYIHFESQLRISLIAPRYDTSFQSLLSNWKARSMHGTRLTTTSRKKTTFPVRLHQISKAMTRDLPSAGNSGLKTPVHKQQQWSRNSST